MTKLFICLLFLSVVVASPVRAQSDPAAMLRFHKDWLASKGRAWNKIDRWLFAYETVSPNGPSVPVHRILATAAPGKMYHLGAHMPTYPWELDPYAQETIIFDQTGIHRRPFNRSFAQYELRNPHLINPAMIKEFFWHVVPMSPLTTREMPTLAQGMRPILYDALRSDDYRLVSTNAQLNGETCFVLANAPIDRLWLSIDKPLCLIRREIRNQDSKLLERITTKVTMKLDEDLWLPRKLTRELYTWPGATSENPRIINVTVVQASLNSAVPDSIFDQPRLPGELQYDKEGGYRQVVSGGWDLLDTIVEFSTVHGGLPTRPNAVGFRFSWLIMGLVAGGVIGISLFRPKSTSTRAET